tara:strand:+ start:1192 stop:2469 length:1278 start_codon:yes stop_codon:yes gene_type:complete
MKVLVVGSGGREHALAWKFAQSERVETVFVAPGNAGSALEQGVKNIEIGSTDVEGLVNFAGREGIGITVIGPEGPLDMGIVDRFREAGLYCLGPTKTASKLEGSKGFAKEFMHRFNIPTGRYQIFSDLADAKEYVRIQGAPIVIKADGLAAGKGVVVALSEDQAMLALEQIMSEGRVGEAGQTVVIEEFLEGEEASFICICDGKTAIPFASSQDHKARDEGDLGPNTGGMGAYSPAPVVTSEIHQAVMTNIIKPTIDGMAAEGAPFVGFLYAGLMIDSLGQARVVEYNCRFGDPEAQAIMMRLDSDFLEVCERALSGKLEGYALSFDQKTSLGVVLAAKGYPDQYEKGLPISGLSSQVTDTKVFHAGTAVKDKKVVTNGGRVLCVASLGEDIMEARTKAYERIGLLDWDGMFFRKDIGHKAVSRR